MTDTALDQISLQNMEKKTSETFREYAYKWRDLVAQVQPPLTDKELNKMFLNTLKAPYYDRMMGNFNKDFSDVVSAREMIEVGVKQGKIESAEAKKLISKRKEGETHTMLYQEKAYNPSYYHNQTMVISLIIGMVEMLRKEIISQTPDPWQDSLHCRHQHMW